MKTILKIVGSIIGIILLVFVMLIGYLSITEYKPADIESMEINGASDIMPDAGQPMRIMSWNIGYGALGDNADFFMDGGSSVRSSTEERIESNMTNIKTIIKSFSPDIVFIQEVDLDSKRSYNINEYDDLANAFTGYMHTFAYNYKAPFVPYPIPNFIGKVEAGLMTLSNRTLTDAKRISLPCPFKWPVRTVNLKRCLMVDRIPVEGTDKELVLINLHLEAYDSGEGKIAQTKQLIEFLNAEYAKGNYVIAGGDFNQSFSNIDISPYRIDPELWVPGLIDAKDFDAHWQLLMDDSLPSCRSLHTAYEGADKENFIYYVIDGFIVSDNVEVTSLKTQDLGFKYSDHNPVVMQIKLK